MYLQQFICILCLFSVFPTDQGFSLSAGPNAGKMLQIESDKMGCLYKLECHILPERPPENFNFIWPLTNADTMLPSRKNVEWIRRIPPHRVASESVFGIEQENPCLTLVWRFNCYKTWHTLSSVTGSGHVKYMASPFFDFYMTTCHVL